jgi:cytochrome c biogenesis protein CcmG, thiol:disulfide interchange protein DsbE
MNLIRTALSLALVAGSVAAMAQQDPSALEGKPLPKFTMKGLDGKVINNASIKGKAVILDFWATWCGPCVKASPLMQELHTKYAKKGLMVIGANVNDQSGAAGKYQKEHKYGYKFTTGGEGLLRTFGFNGIPAFVFVNKKGIIEKVQIGYGPSAAPAFDKLAKKMVS